MIVCVLVCVFVELVVVVFVCVCVVAVRVRARMVRMTRYGIRARRFTITMLRRHARAHIRIAPRAARRIRGIMRVR